MAGLLLGKMLGKDKEKPQEALHEEESDTLDPRYQDPLTGMKNGIKFQQDYCGMLEKDGHVLVGIFLDGFHRLNSLFGLRLGGETILRMCPILEKFAAAHGGDFYRPMPDELYLLAEAPDQQEFLNDLKNLFMDLEQIYVKDQHVTYFYHYTYNYGVYFLSNSDDRANNSEMIIDVVKSAIKGLRHNSGTVGTVINDKPDWELLDALTKDVRRAWQNREFIPYYQMIYDLKSRKPVGAEILTRWKHPDHGLLMPKVFLPVMEREGLIMDLDLYMLDEACRRIKKWIDDELVTVPICVNISRLNLYRIGFVDRVIKIVKSYDIPPILIELEVSESSMMMEKTDTSEQIIDRLHEFGFSISLDNVGEEEGSSVNMIRTLPLNTVKVKPRFFKDVETSGRDRIFVTGCLSVAKEIGIDVVGMEVETEEQVNQYIEMGCELGQGYYFSRPESQEDFEKEIF